MTALCLSALSHPLELALPHAVSAQPHYADPHPSATATPDPYVGLMISELAQREYGDGELTVENTSAETPDFTRYLITYPSDGLNIYGFMNVPTGEGPFPVLLVLHGYVRQQYRRTLTYTTRYADALARAGYLVIHPNYRTPPRFRR